MIKAQDGAFYLTAGETCYIFKADGDGHIKHLHLGSRVEFEDDLASLGYTAANVDEFTFGEFSRGGKKLSVDFVLDCAEVAEDKPKENKPTLGGGKTLILFLKDGAARLRAELYITTYSRGGYSRRAVIINDGKMPVTANMNLRCGVFSGERDTVCVLADGTVERNSHVNKKSVVGMTNFIAVTERSATEAHGEAYGFLCAYGDGVIEATHGGGVTEVVSRDKDMLTIAAGERYASPEILTVFSDNGIGGMTRVFHDILREFIGVRSVSERRHTVLFCPTLPEKKLCEAAVAATELGFDVFAVNGGEVDASTLGKLAEVCKDEGVKLGLKVRPEHIEKTSALYTNGCAATDNNGVYKIELSDDVAESEFADTLENIIAVNDVEYVMIDVMRGNRPFALGTYRLRGRLAERFGDAIIEWGAISTEMRYGNSLCYPSCIVRNVVTAEPEKTFKARFDKATFGCLGYKLDPLALGADLKRAVRAQILSYQDDAPTVICGDLYRTETSDGALCHMSVTKDKSRAYAICMPSKSHGSHIKLVGLDEHNLYRVRELDKTYSGAALVHCGITVPRSGGEDDTFVLHIRQVADFDN